MMKAIGSHVDSWLQRSDGWKLRIDKAVQCDLSIAFPDTFSRPLYAV